MTIEQQKWNKMWKLWVDGLVKSPYKELMTYHSEINNGGHFQYFINIENSGDIKKEIAALECILSEKLNDNLQRAKARLVLELDGGGHYTAKQADKDELRTKELEAMIEGSENLQFGYRPQFSWCVRIH